MARTPYLRGDEATRFWPKVDCSDGTDGCWLWTAARNGDGYGIFRRSNKTNVRAHVWVWEQVHGPVPDGKELDHVGCDNPACCNPRHLNAVTHAENVGRAKPGRRSWRRERSHCKNGHEFHEGNTRLANGYRVCKDCAREASTRFRG